MLQETKDRACFMCGTVPARWNDPAIADDPGQAGPEEAGLSRRRLELERGETTPEELHAHLLQMCAMCQEVVMDVGEGASKDDVLSRLAFRIDRLRTMASGMTSAARPHASS